MRKQAGFTLIELLVVIAIIGILAAVILGALGNARARARDTQRESDLHQIQSALELYYQDHGQYPQVAAYSNDSFWPTLAADLKPYLATLPTDPINNGLFTTGASNYTYYYYPDNSGTTKGDYDLIARLESKGVASCSSAHYTQGLYGSNYGLCKPACTVAACWPDDGQLYQGNSTKPRF